MAVYYSDNDSSIDCTFYPDIVYNLFGYPTH